MLNVKLYSFSYLKSGIPTDQTPHKGGFVFDCRYIKNPRWEPRLQSLNGKDQAVIEFLDSVKPMQDFLRNVSEILTEAVDNYISREFTSLMVCFGCSGGQHRSIYAAEKIHKFLEAKYKGKIIVTVEHIEFPELSVK
jgi:RNase adaptor protein for sRNA GlmZ degradation